MGITSNKMNNKNQLCLSTEHMGHFYNLPSSVSKLLESDKKVTSVGLHEERHVAMVTWTTLTQAIIVLIPKYIFCFAKSCFECCISQVHHILRVARRTLESKHADPERVISILALCNDPVICLAFSLSLFDLRRDTKCTSFRALPVIWGALQTAVAL